MRPFVARNGVAHVVTAEHAALIDGALGADWPDADSAERERLAILETSNQRPLTKDERARLEATTHIKNLHACAAFVERHGVDHGALFGHGAGLDNVHGGEIRHACGCTVAVAFDHHRRQDPENPVHRVAVIARCEAHAGITGNEELYRTLDAKG